MSGRVLLLELSNPLEELLCPSLFEQSHERGPQSLTGVRGHLGHSRLGSLALLDVAAGDLLKFQVSSNIGGNQDVGQLSVGHQQLGDQVDVPVVDPPVLLPGLLAGSKVAVLLEKLRGRSVQGTLSMIREPYGLNVDRCGLSEPLLVLPSADAIVGSSKINLPSIVVIAVDVQDLVALHTKDTGREERTSAQSHMQCRSKSHLPRQHALGQAWRQ